VHTGEQVHICANITNTYKQRLVFDVSYDIRCSSDISNDTMTDRSTIFLFTEERGVGSGQSQYQCLEFHIPYEDYLLYRTSGCYATAKVDSEFVTNSIGRQTSKSSSNINITDYGYYPQYETNPDYPLIRLFPDWRRFDDIIENKTKSYYRTKINLSKLVEDYLDPDGAITDNAWDVYVVCGDTMPSSQEHYNYTALSTTTPLVFKAV